MKNRSCVTVFGSCSATLTVGEPLGDVSGSVNHDFLTSVTGISSEIDASIIYSKCTKPMNQARIKQFLSGEAKKFNMLRSFQGAEGKSI